MTIPARSVLLKYIPPDMLARLNSNFKFIDRIDTQPNYSPKGRYEGSKCQELERTHILLKQPDGTYQTSPLIHYILEDYVPT